MGKTTAVRVWTLVIAGLTVIEAAASANSGAEYLPRWPGIAPGRNEPNPT